jgi:ATP-binding cassette subfamily F protein 3
MEDTGRALEKAHSDDSKTALLLEEYHRLQEAVENSGYYRREADIDMVLRGLGFSVEDTGRGTGEFSGGWQMRIALAKVLLERPDILLLDEPTNYLDIEARGWLETWLKDFSGGYLLVSHDRYFLDVTINEVYELFGGNLKRYAGNYSNYEKIRDQELEALVKRYEAQQEEIARTEALIRRFRYKATKAAFAQELIKRLEKMERIVIPENLKRISISFPPPPHSGRMALSLTALGKSYGERRIFSGLDLTVESGERLVVVGRNGTGKSSLLRVLAGVDGDFEGNFQYGTGIAVGYFSQDGIGLLEETSSGRSFAASGGMKGPDGSRQIIEFIEAEAPTALIPRIRDLLGAFLFRGDDVYKPLSVLSGGEQSRLAMLRMLLKPVNLLILDEPTNHLDLQSKDILLDTLRAFKGTIIFVSHDRDFMEALSTKTLELAGNPPSPDGRLGGAQSRVRLFYGNYGYYLDRLEREATVPPGAPEDKTPDSPEEPPRRNEVPAPASETPRGNSPAPGLQPVILIKASQRRELEKQRQALIRRLERQEAEILAALESLEAERARLEGELSRPEVYSSGEKARTVQIRLDAANGEISGKTAEWEHIVRELSAARQD